MYIVAILLKTSSFFHLFIENTFFSPRQYIWLNEIPFKYKQTCTLEKTRIVKFYKRAYFYFFIKSTAMVVQEQSYQNY